MSDTLHEGRPANAAESDNEAEAEFEPQPRAESAPQVGPERELGPEAESESGSEVEPGPESGQPFEHEPRAGSESEPAHDAESTYQAGPAYHPESAYQAEPAAGPVLSSRTAAGFRDRWHEIQAAFIDDPHRAVEDADRLVADVAQAFASGVEEQRRSLASAWAQDGQAKPGEHDAQQTEELRLTIRSYRTLADRLLRG
jgi:hypothetical protein